MNEPNAQPKAVKTGSAKICPKCGIRAYADRCAVCLDQPLLGESPNPTLPEGMSREQAVLALRELRDLATAAESEADPGFKRWPVLDALIDHIAEHGLPPNSVRTDR